ncbi:hypothetical protein ES703_104674 [subsurface metagenome]
MIAQAPEDPPQAVLRRAETKPFLQHIRGLLENKHLQAVPHACDIRRRTLHRNSGLANDEGIVHRQVSVRVHGLVPDPHPVQSLPSLSLGIEERNLSVHLGGFWARHDVDRERIRLSLAVAELEGRAKLILAGGQGGR